MDRLLVHIVITRL